MRDRKWLLEYLTSLTPEGTTALVHWPHDPDPTWPVEIGFRQPHDEHGTITTPAILLTHGNQRLFINH